MNNQAAKRELIAGPLLSVSYKSPALLGDFLNSLPEAVIITDPNFYITGLNPAAESIYGSPIKEIMGKSLFELSQYEIVGCSLVDTITELLNKGFWKGKTIFRCYNGQELYFNTTGTLIRDEKGNVSAIALVNQNFTETIKHENKLAVIENKYQTVVETLSEGVLLINADGKIGTANNKAAEILGLSEEELQGKVVACPSWKAIKEDGSVFPPEEFPAIVTLSSGKEHINVIMGIEKPTGKRIWISVNSKAIFKEGKTAPDAVVASFKDITNEKNAAIKLKESELVFRTFMENSPTLGWIYDEEGNFIYGNSLFKERIGVTEEAIGKHILTFTPRHLAETILAKNKLVLLRGEPLITEDELTGKDSIKRIFLAYWFLLPVGTNKKLIGGHAIDITDRKNAQEEIEKMHERFLYAANASSDTIWDYDLRTNEIYRSDNFNKISGYAKEEILPNLSWWFEKIHPEDKVRVQQKMQAQLKNGNDSWEDEYRFKYADGTFRQISDKGFIVYDNDEPVRLIGALQDITERKKLESQLLNDQVQKQKLINQATIKAQEKERGMISAELHDNVNQLLMSAKLHIGAAKNTDEAQNELLSKASEYLLMAVEEIRALSKKLNSSIVKTVGLQKSIFDICSNMKQFNNIAVTAEIEESIIEKLTPEQQLMIFRILQEQSNNIIKYAEATTANISIKEKNNYCCLVISDNGKGFDKELETAKGIGFINIFNRADAYNGNVEIVTSPGKGCRLNIQFPLDL